MKLIFVTKKVCKGDGQARVNYELARFALEHGRQVVVIAQEIDESLIDKGAVFEQIRPMRFPDILLDISFVILASLRLFRYRNSYIIGNGFSLIFPHSLNLVHFVHSGWQKSVYYQPHLTLNPRTWYYFFYTLSNSILEKISFSLAKEIVAVSTMIEKELISFCDIPARTIRTIYNGVDPNEFSPVKKLHKKIIGIFVGDIRTNRKNLDSVLLAMREIPKLNLWVIGDDRGSAFPKLTKEYELDGRVTFLGYRRDIHKILPRGDIFVFPSRYDPCPLVIMEALASGLAVITSKQTGNWKIASTAGKTIDNPENIVKLRKVISELVDSPEIIIKYKNEARKIALEHSWSKVCQKYFEVIDS